MLAGEDLVGNEVCRGNREHTLQRDLYIKRIFFLRPFLGTPNPGKQNLCPCSFNPSVWPTVALIIPFWL